MISVTLLVLCSMAPTRAQPVAVELRELRCSRQTEIECVALFPDGKKAVAGTQSGSVLILPLEAGGKEESVSITDGGLLTGSIRSIVVSPDGKRIFAGCADRCVRVIDAEKLTVVATLDRQRGPVAFLKEPSSLAFSGSTSDNAIRQWDLRTGKEVFRLSDEKVRERSETLSLSPDGKMLASLNFMQVQLWDLAARKPLRTIAGHDSRIVGAYFSADGKTIFSGDSFGCFRVSDPQTGKCLRQLRPFDWLMYRFAVSHNGERLITGGTNRFQVIDPGSGRVLCANKEGTIHGRVSVAISSDGQLAVTGEWYGPVRLWRLSPKAK
jgi:WD domain, G-beta repeat